VGEEGPHDDRVFHTERLAVNFVMQGSNAAITKAAR
jgi:DNA polymerase I-like protein with 3'-5' exonuclease and polymerase domains